MRSDHRGGIELESVIQSSDLDIPYPANHVQEHKNELELHHASSVFHRHLPYFTHQEYDLVRNIEVTTKGMFTCNHRPIVREIRLHGKSTLLPRPQHY
ncbi:hypothetical protein TNCV_1862331 [Trichonephila clavipes]|nr:hypothetical protein TNCV_1862331 [Trichonephila clavipes]